jgi:hypothetical protein
LRPLRITAFGLAVLLLIGGAVGAVAYLGRPWYVSADNGHVALFRGHGDSGPFKAKLVDRTDVPLKSLDGVAQQHVRQGVEFDSRKEAEAYIRRLPTTTTSTSTTTSSTLFVPTTTTLKQ